MKSYSNVKDHHDSCRKKWIKLKPLCQVNQARLGETLYVFCHMQKVDLKLCMCVMNLERESWKGNQNY